jgi:glucose/mannose-6-phosphate isomerase
MVGYTNLQGDYHILIFKDNDEHERNLKRIEITSKIWQKKGILVSILEMEGKNVLEKMFYSIIFGDWISYYLALEYGQDPTPVEMVEDLKRKLG